MSRGRNHRSRIRLLRRSLSEAELICAASDAEIRGLENVVAALRREGGALRAENAALYRLADKLAGEILRVWGELEAARSVVGAQEREIERTATATGQVVRLAEQATQIQSLRRERDELRERLGLIEGPPFA